MIQTLLSIFLLALMACQEPKENPFERPLNEIPSWREKALEEGGYFSSSSRFYSSSSNYHSEKLNSAGQLVVDLGYTGYNGSFNLSIEMDSLDLLIFRDYYGSYLKICLAKKCNAKNYKDNFKLSNLYHIQVEEIAKQFYRSITPDDLIENKYSILQAVDFSRTAPWRMKNHTLSPSDAAIALSIQSMFIYNSTTSIVNNILYMAPGTYDYYLETIYSSDQDPYWHIKNLTLIGSHPSNTKINTKRILTRSYGSMSNLSLSCADSLTILTQDSFQLNNVILSTPYINMKSTKTNLTNTTLQNIKSIKTSSTLLNIKNSTITSAIGNNSYLLDINSGSNIQISNSNLYSANQVLQINPSATLTWDGGRIKGFWKVTQPSKYNYVKLSLRNLQIDSLAHQSYVDYISTLPNTETSFQCSQVWGQSPTSKKDTLFCGN